VIDSALWPSLPLIKTPGTRPRPARHPVSHEITARSGLPKCHGVRVTPTRTATVKHGDLHPANVLTADGTFCGVIDFGALCVGDPAWDLAAGWILLPTGAVDRFYRPAANGANGADDSHGADAATRRRARGLAVIKALVCILIGDAGEHGRPGGKPTWGPPGHAALQRLTATAPR
jgi:hypothetical protein